MTSKQENKPVDLFEIICRFKDSRPSNLNQLFSSYGCQTLEARVPIVNRGVAEQVKNDINRESQRYGTLALKSEAASNAVDGRIPRTRNRHVQLIEIGKEVVIAAGHERDRSPVDRIELDDEMEIYRRETAEIMAKKAEVMGMKKKARETRERAFLLPELTAALNLAPEPNWDE